MSEAPKKDFISTAIFLPVFSAAKILSAVKSSKNQHPLLEEIDARQ